MRRITSSRARELLSRASNVRVLVVGDLMLDRYIIGSVDRISPEAPVPVVRVESESWALGGAGNVAANVVALGAECDVVGGVGQDTEGQILRGRLEALGVGVAGLVELENRPTTVKTRIMARHQHITRIDREDSSDISEIQARNLADAVRSLSPSAAAIALEDYNKGVMVLSLIRATLAAGRGRSIPTVVDPKRLRFFDFMGATVFKPNSRELEDALGERLQPDNPEWMAGVRERLGCETLLLTLGESGMAVQGIGNEYMRVPTVAREVYDVSGAGDTVTAVIAVALAVDATPMEAAILANHAAAVEVGKAGVATVSPAEILKQQEAFVEKEFQ
ncbi:MAG: PfkB family carbohydrate kinase [Longimicrobiales bacterium]|nr:PfkB family carbohydrate kinase [Longimicrobiales bacterium]